MPVEKNYQIIYNIMNYLYIFIILKTGRIDLKEGFAQFPVCWNNIKSCKSLNRLCAERMHTALGIAQYYVQVFGGYPFGHGDV